MSSVDFWISHAPPVVPADTGTIGHFQGSALSWALHGSALEALKGEWLFSPP
jgi:hypothetical protein